jgi:hypothetical protein
MSEEIIMIMAKPALPTNELLKPILPPDQTVKIIGLGGVGSIVTRYGAMLLATLAKVGNVRLVLIDGDVFEASNATRMFFSGYGNKAAVTRADLLPRFADSRLTMLAIEEYVTPENCPRLLQDRDIVIATVDNHASRKLISDYCAAHLNNVVLISGGNDGVGPDSAGKIRRGTYGNCQIFIRSEGRDLSPSLTRYHSEIGNPADQLPTDQGCAELVSSVPQLLLANLQAAAAILNTLWLHLCNASHYSELAFDIAEGLMRPIPLPAPDRPRHS